MPLGAWGSLTCVGGGSSKACLWLRSPLLRIVGAHHLFREPPFAGWLSSCDARSRVLPGALRAHPVVSCVSAETLTFTYLNVSRSLPHHSHREFFKLSIPLCVRGGVSAETPVESLGLPVCMGKRRTLTHSQCVHISSLPYALE